MAKTLGRDGMIGSVILEGLAYEFRSRTDAEDSLVKWTDSEGNVQAKLTGAGFLKVYNAPTVPEDVGSAGYTATYYLPLTGGTLSGALNMGGFKVTNVGSASADTDVLTRTAGDSRFLKQTDAATTYLTQASATATYLSQANATTMYAPKTGSTEYATQSQLSGYYTQTQALQTFAPISGSANYAPVSGSPNYASTASLASYATKASPSFTGTVSSAGLVDAPAMKVDYIASPSLPLSGSHGYLFDAGVNPSGGIAQSPTTIFLVAPNQTGAAVSCVKNASGAVVYVPVYVADPSIDRAAVSLSYFNTHAANTGSDKRLKTNIAELPSSLALSKVRQLQGTTFKFLRDGLPNMGLIADEVQSIVPEAVREAGGYDEFLRDGDSPIKTLQPMALIALLIESVKVLAERIEALEAK